MLFEGGYGSCCSIAPAPGHFCCAQLSFHFAPDCAISAAKVNVWGKGGGRGRAATTERTARIYTLHGISVFLCACTVASGVAVVPGLLMEMIPSTRVSPAALHSSSVVWLIIPSYSVISVACSMDEACRAWVGRNLQSGLRVSTPECRHCEQDGC